jgi:hypothetical protein
MGSTAALATFHPLRASGFDLGSVFGTVLGAVGVGLFPGAAAALGGFQLIRFLGNAADLAGNANSLVDQTKNLESHFDSVLSQVSTTLVTINSFVQDCDAAVREIETLVKQLPGSLAVAFDAAIAKAAFGRLRGNTANMAAYLQTKGSIITNRKEIQRLSEKIVNDISTIDAVQTNSFQAVMQIIPALTTWVQGYTAYNLLQLGDQRGTNPWDHQIISSISLPRITDLIDGIKGQNKESGDIDSQLPLEAGVIYTFDGTSFARTKKKFAPKYSAGEIDNGFYYCIYPDGISPSQVFAPGVFVTQPKPGDFCYLWDLNVGVRVWVMATAPAELPPGVFQTFKIPTSAAAESAAFAYPRLMSAALKNLKALNQLTEGWQMFDNAVKSKLVNGDRDIWTKLPQLTA